MADNELARHCAVHHQTVATIRKELEASGAIEASPVREHTREGEVLQQRVRGSGKPRERQPVPDTDPEVTGPDEPTRSAGGARTQTAVQTRSTPTATANGEQPIDEEVAVAVIKRYRRLKFFHPIRAAELLVLGTDRMTVAEVEAIGGWFINVAEEMSLRGGQ